MNIIFMGTPVFAQHIVQAMHDAGFTPSAVFTQPPRPAGRGMKLTPSPVAQWAQQHNIAVHSPVSFKREPQFTNILQQHQPHVTITAAYGLLLPQSVLNVPSVACLNVHASLLPRWRGAAPIHRCIEAGDTHSGVTLMHMSAGLDEGDMALGHTMPLPPHITTPVLHNELARIGAQLTVQALQILARGEALPRIPQPTAGVNYAAKITSTEALLDPQQGVQGLERKIRALAPMVYMLHAGERLKILQARVADSTTPANALRWQVSDGVLELLQVQRAGRSAVQGAEYARGLGGVWVY